MTLKKENSEKLAIYEGTPVREKPLPKSYIGSTIYGKEECQEGRRLKLKPQSEW